MCHYRGPEGFRRAEDAWLGVLREVPDRHFELTPDWHRSHFDAADAWGTAHVFVVRRNGEPVAVLPLAGRRERIGGIPLAVLGQPDLEVRQDIAIAGGVPPKDVWRALLLFVSECDGFDSEALVLRRARRTQGVLEVSRLARVIPRGLSATVRCDRSYDDLLAATSPGYRRRLRGARRRLEQLGRASYMVASRPDDLEAALDVFLDLEASGWKGAHGFASAIHLDPVAWRHYQRVVRHFGARGECQIRLLLSEGRCIAGQLCLQTGRSLAIVKIAHDEDYRFVWPGHLLLANSLAQWCAAPDIDEADFISDPVWTDPWRPTKRPIHDLVVFGGGVRSQLACRMNEAGGVLGRWADGVLERLSTYLIGA